MQNKIIDRFKQQVGFPGDFFLVTAQNKTIWLFAGLRQLQSHVKDLINQFIASLTVPGHLLR